MVELCRGIPLIAASAQAALYLITRHAQRPLGHGSWTVLGCSKETRRGLLPADPGPESGRSVNEVSNDRVCKRAMGPRASTERIQIGRREPVTG